MSEPLQPPRRRTRPTLTPGEAPLAPPAPRRPVSALAQVGEAPLAPRVFVPPEDESCPGERVIEQPVAGEVRPDDAFLLDHVDRGTRQASAEAVAEFFRDTIPPDPTPVDYPEADLIRDDDVLPLDHEERGERKTTAEDLADYVIEKIPPDPPPPRVIDRPHDTPTDPDAIGLDSEAEGERQTTVGELSDLILSRVPPPPPTATSYPLTFVPSPVTDQPGYHAAVVDVGTTDPLTMQVILNDGRVVGAPLTREGTLIRVGRGCAPPAGEAASLVVTR